MKNTTTLISRTVVAVQHFLEHIIDAPYDPKKSTILTPPPFIDVEVVTASGERFIAYRKLFGKMWILLDPETESPYTSKPINKHDKWKILM
jgi:hypothetical protein